MIKILIVILIIVTSCVSCSNKLIMNLEHEKSVVIVDSLNNGLYKIKHKYFIIVDSVEICKCHSQTYIKHANFSFFLKKCHLEDIKEILEGQTDLTNSQKKEIYDILLTLKKW